MKKEKLKKELWQIVKPLRISEKTRETYLLNQGSLTGIRNPEQFIENICDIEKQHELIFSGEWRVRQAVKVLGHYLLIEYKTDETPQWISDYYQYLKAGIYDAKFPLIYEELQLLERNMLWQIGLLKETRRQNAEVMKALTVLLLYFDYIQNCEYLEKLLLILNKKQHEF